jgi:hypothetical protein
VSRTRLAVPMLLAVAVTAGAPALAAAAPRMSIVYDEQPAVRTLTDPAGPGAALGGPRGVFRQDPGIGGMFDPAGNDDAYRVAKIDADALLPLSPEAMAAAIRHEIDDPETHNTSGLVAIDEIGNAFNDGKVRITYKTVRVRGKRIRIWSGNRIIVTRKGWRIARGKAAALPPVSPGTPGARLSSAMEILAATPYPGGGTYAQRVHIYVAPAFSTSIAAGRGPERNLGNDGKPHRATWRGVFPALAQAGGVWLEMYHSSRKAGITSFTAREWRTVPKGFLSYARRYQADQSRFHLVMTGDPAGPAGARGCEPMACQWQLAAATRAGAAMLATGPGAYRLGGLAGAWRAEFNRVFGAS